MGKKRVIVAGHACLDITPVFPSDTKATVLGEVLSPGKLVQMKGADINPGGAVSNTGIAMKLLGIDVSLAAKIGEDGFGTILSGIYDSYGAGSGIIACKGERTSYSAVIAVPGIDRIFLHDPGANNTFSLEDVKKLDFTDVVLFHFGYPPLMEKIFENQGQQLVEIFKYVKSLGVATSLDMVMVDENSLAGRQDWKEILKKVLPYVDFFVPSVEETCWMLDRGRYQEWAGRTKGGDMCLCIKPEDIKPLADTVIEYGAKVLLLKCGAPGLYYKTASEKEMTELAEITGLNPKTWSNKEGFEESFRPSKVVSGTGAGDTTIAAFLTSMLKGDSLEDAVRLAAAEGASCVEDYGALGGIKSLDELRTKIAAGWENNSF